MASLLNQRYLQVEAEYSLGISLITIAFIYLFYVMTYTKSSYKIPKTFLLLYSLGGFILVLKNVGDKHIYVTVNEIIGSLIALLLYFR